jgi:hypothetical protein
MYCASECAGYIENQHERVERREEKQLSEKRSKSQAATLLSLVLLYEPHYCMLLFFSFRSVLPLQVLHAARATKQTACTNTHCNATYANTIRSLGMLFLSIVSFLSGRNM